MDEAVATYFVSRHAGAKEWARRRALHAVHVSRLDRERIAPGDVVYGTLPIHLAAAVTEKGGRYYHVEMDVDERQRGLELSADDMERFNARLVEYCVKRC